MAVGVLSVVGTLAYAKMKAGSAAQKRIEVVQDMKRSYDSAPGLCK